MKLLGKKEKDLRQQIRIAKAFSGDIHMEFVLNRCANIVLKKGKMFPSTNLIIDVVRDSRITA